MTKQEYMKEYLKTHPLEESDVICDDGCAFTHTLKGGEYNGQRIKYFVTKIGDSTSRWVVLSTWDIFYDSNMIEIKEEK